MKFSICIPVKGRADMLTQALEGIFGRRDKPGQTHQNYEVIIKDESETSLVDFLPPLRYEERLRYMWWPHDGKPYRGLNECLSVATGDIFYFHGSDDLLASPDVLQRVNGAFSFLGADDPHWAYGRSININKAGEEIPSPYNWDGGQKPTTLALMCQANHICCSTVFWNRAMLEVVGQFNEHYTDSCDYDMWLRMWAIAEPVWLDFPVTKYRYWPGQLSVLNSANMQREADEIKRKYAHR